MAGWTKILPFFVVAWLAKRNCERFDQYAPKGWRAVEVYWKTLLMWEPRHER